MTYQETLETAIRDALSKLFDPPLSEQQIQSVIRRTTKIIEDGHAEDYAFVTAISRYQPRNKQHVAA